MPAPNYSPNSLCHLSGSEVTANNQRPTSATAPSAIVCDIFSSYFYSINEHTELTFLNVVDTKGSTVF